MIGLVLSVYKYWIRHRDGTTTHHSVEAENRVAAGEKVVDNHDDKVLYSKYGFANWGWVADSVIGIWFFLL
jgi:outer membrane biogenesis lipoprotein LolB